MASENNQRAAGQAGPPNATLWTAAVGVALVALTLAPRRDRRAAAAAGPNETGRTGMEPTGGAPPRSKAGRDARGSARNEADRGRAAETPEQIPAAGWKDILVRVYQSVGEDRLLLVSAGVTFYAVLAIFPAIAALVSVYGLFADAGTVNEHIALLQGFMPGGALDIIGEQVKRIAQKGGGTLSLTLIVSVLLSVWSANGGVKSVIDALNIVYKEKEKRSFFWLNVRALSFTAGALLFVLVALGGIVIVPVVLNLFGLDAKAWYLALLRWPALLLIVLGMLAVLYRFGPSRDAPQWRWVTWGSGAAGVLWIAVSGAFSWYVASFGTYNETYGSLGAAIGFMTWIWISTIIVLAGAEINAEMEHQTAKDTTQGEPKPMGGRQAQMADSVGASAADQGR